MATSAHSAALHGDAAVDKPMDMHMRTTPSTTPGNTPYMTPTLRPTAEPRGAVVADVVGVHGTPVCTRNLGLVDAAGLLLSADRTAAVVVNEEGTVTGIFSESDVLAAYLSGNAWTQTVGGWLQSGYTPELSAITVPPEATLREAAEKMLQLAAASGIARHHLFVQSLDGRYHGVLSSLDVSRAVYARDLPSHEWDADMVVARVMRPREAIPTCSPKCSVEQLLRALLTSRQHAVLVADELGVHGMITPRDMLQAFVREVPTEQDAWNHLTGWMGGVQICFDRRIIASSMMVWQAADVMAAASLHHLVVVKPGTDEVAGIVSALDLARCCGGTCAGLVVPTRGLAGPLVAADIAEQRITPVCKADSSMTDACDLLILSGRSAALVVEKDGSPAGLITENDFLKAHHQGLPWHTDVGIWLKSGEARFPSSLLPELTLEPAALLREAAAKMVDHAASGNHACHHVLVRAGEAFGPGRCSILSSLDVARSYCEFDSERIAKEDVRVSSVMQPKACLPTLQMGGTLCQAFASMLESRKNCALVVNAHGKVRGMITPRDVLRTFAEHLSGTTSLAGWLRGLGGSLELRVITSDARLVDAAASMAAHAVHHLLVVEPGKADIIGVVSSLDLASALRSEETELPPEVQALHAAHNWNVIRVPAAFV